jgi:hypothetical protein
VSNSSKGRGKRGTARPRTARTTAKAQVTAGPDPAADIPAEAPAAAPGKAAVKGSASGASGASGAPAGAAAKAPAGTGTGTEGEAAGIEPAGTETAAGSAAAAAAAASGTPTPRLLLAAAVAGLQGLAVAAWGVTTCFTGGHNAVPAGLLVLVFAAIPLAAAHGLRRARRWSRGPALIMQLLSLPIAWAMMHSDGPVVPGGIALGVLAIAGLVLLVHPATTDALGIKRTASS